MRKLTETKYNKFYNVGNLMLRILQTFVEFESVELYVGNIDERNIHVLVE